MRDGRGVQDTAETYHESPSCTHVVGDPIREISVSRALKWDLELCAACVDTSE
jgi:hypothetical protein